MDVQNKDDLIHFIFDNAPAHGAIVTLDKSYTEILNRHPYTPPVQHYLGQALAGVSLMRLKLHEEGTIILQVEGDGPLSLLLTQVNEKCQIRGLATTESPEKIHHDFSKALGKGKMVVTQMPQRYQGVVDMRHPSLSTLLESYFLQSEQVPVMVLLAANDTRACGFFIQYLPKNAEENEHDKNQWDHIIHLSKTLTAHELLNNPSSEILYKLFHQEKLRILDSHSVEFYCRCTRTLMEKTIISLGLADARKLISEQSNKKISVTCEFCHAKTDFDSIDIENIFIKDIPHAKYS